MPTIPNKALKQILNSIPDRKQRDVIASIMTGKITKHILCLSEDVREEQEVPLLDKKGEPVLYKTGDKKGQPKTEKKEVLVREGCNGRVIAHVYDNGKIRMAASDGKAWLRATRHRLDGHLGFQCWCGNDSRLSDAEKGVEAIEHNAIDKAAIEQVYENLKTMKKEYPVEGKRQVIDGFAIEELA